MAPASDVTLAGTAEPAPQAGGPQAVDLGQQLKAGTLKIVNREAAAVDGRPTGVHLSAKPGIGLAWIEGSDFAEGTIELDIRGKDVLQQSFVGIAFHGKDDTTYEAVYLRPFNFRAQDPVRHQHAVQYIAQPDYDWPRLRKEFPEEFENPVDPSIAPTDWVPVRVVVKGRPFRCTSARCRHRHSKCGSSASRLAAGRIVGGQQQRRRLRESADHADEVTRTR